MNQQIKMYLMICIKRIATDVRVGQIILACALTLAGTCAEAGGGLFGLDHELSLDQSGIWSRKVQLDLEVGVVATEVAGALWFGNGDPLGHTFWQAVDASAISGIAAQGLKVAFSRARPYQGDNPNQWFQGRCCQSFPSGEVTLQASFVTPFIARYAAQDPWVWSLELLPLYDGIARMKSQAHWQSDVIAGWALGSGLGYWATKRQVPLTVQILPHGLTVGFATRF